MAKQPLKAGEKILFSVFGVFVLVAVVGYVILEVVRLNMDKPLFTQRTHYDLSELGKKGSLLYREAQCNSCHRVMRSGTSMGLSLDGVGSKRSYEWLLSFLQEPERVYPGNTLDHGDKPKEAAYVAQMPQENLVAIATFLSEVKADRGSSVAPQPPKGDSPFIDSMVRTFAPKNWEEKGYTDQRKRDQESQVESSQ